ncbi:MAG: 2-amino-4-hydroxy-6-hydroxymethyldihydropteridine diphosphokinase [Microthrixaceae bacterium]
MSQGVGGGDARRVFLSLGSNLGDRRAHLRNAVDSLPGVVAVSPLYETDPLGGPDQEPFLNIVVELATELTPNELLGLCHRLEAGAERVREERWGPRTLDVDIVWMEGGALLGAAHDPPPRWRERRFVLAPLRDLAPELVSEADVHMAHGTVAALGEL